MFQRSALLTLSLVALGCATQIPYQQPLAARPLAPRAGEKVIVDHALVIFDSSGSIDPQSQFPSEKALLESFVRGMPEGRYNAGGIAFGGFERQVVELQRFDRNRLKDGAAQVRHLREATPLPDVIGEAQQALRGSEGTAALVLFSDGQPTDYAGSPADPQLSLAAAKQLASAHRGRTCIHTVLVGEDPAGAAFLQKLSNTTNCGSFRRASGVNNVASLEGFQREVFLGKAELPRVAAPAQDADRDGVYDANDRCPGTPLGAKVDARGCWTIRNVQFRHDSSAIESDYSPELRNVADVLRKNPGVRVRLDGHTDSSGTEPYNESLSKRRAQAVKDYLLSAGIPASRLETRGFGEAKPVRPNDTRENRRENRRTEITVLE